MTDLILILSQCLKKTKRVKHNEYFCKFHFKGYYLGEKIENILVKAQDGAEFEVGADYLLWVKRLSIESGILKVEPIKYKKISE